MENHYNIYKDKFYIRGRDETHAVPDDLQEQIKEKLGYDIEDYSDYVVVY